MPCNPNYISLPVPSGSTAAPSLGFGTPFALRLPEISGYPTGFPEDLLDLLNRFQFLIPSGILKPQLSANFSKDVLDSLLSLMDQFMPFLMLYKFFLPLLNIVICIIEVLCALMNPFKLISAIHRLFNKCIPEFLNIFPIFALIIMVISLLLLIVALIEYIAAQILKLVALILRNINALNNAFQNGDSNGVLVIAQKLSALLCAFQNLFVLFSIFSIIIDVIRDILSLAFSIPPCQDGNSGDINSCCTPDVCPEIVQSNYTRFTGTFKYIPQFGTSTLFAGFPSPFNQNNFTIRNESWQFFDTQETPAQALRNIFDAIDVTTTDGSPKPVFFPADSTYTATADIKQVPYLFDMRMFYVPQVWGRTGQSRFIRFTNIIMPTVPTTSLFEADNSVQNIFNGVSGLVGGAGFEDDGKTPLSAYQANGITPTTGTATINNFFHMPARFEPASSFFPPSINDGYTINNVEYTFKPNIAPLLQKSLVTLGCVPSVALSKGFINNIFASDIGLKTQSLTHLLNGTPNPATGETNTFPDPNAAQQCLLNAIATLRSNMTTEGVAEFQATCDLCLGQLLSDTNSALDSLIGIGIDPCQSSFSLSPTIQFTTRPIIISVAINETNGLSLTNGLSVDVATNIASRLSAHTTFGTASNFSYDGYALFTSQLTSPIPGDGSVMISFDNNTFCTNTFSADANTAPTHTLQSISYQFIQAGTVPTAEGDTNGQPRRDAGDVARDGV